MMYNVNDMVVIRPDLIDDGEPYGEFLAVAEMIRYAGKTAKILSVNYHYGYYRIDLDEEVWKWTDEMIAGYAIINDESIETFGEVDLDAVIF